MNTMNMPGFTADASLYQTSGRYQTGKHTLNLPEQMTSPIYPAMVNLGIHCGNCVGGECAELHCFEGWVRSGGSPGGPYESGGERWFGGGSVGGGTVQRRPHTICCGEGRSRRCTTKLCPAHCVDSFSSCAGARPTIQCCA